MANKYGDGRTDEQVAADEKNRERAEALAKQARAEEKEAAKPAKESTSAKKSVTK